MQEPAETLKESTMNAGVGDVNRTPEDDKGEAGAEGRTTVQPVMQRLAYQLFVAYVSVNALVVLIEPEAPGASILTGSDAVWFVFMTVATVGYGDVVTATDAGRLIGVALMIIGVSAFLVLTSFIVSTSADLNRIGGFSCPLDL